MKEPLLVKVAALGGSLLGFYIAKQNEREVIPLLMIGGLLGGCLAEWVIPEDKANQGHKQKEETR